jgi:hypothetical protein
MKLRYLASIAVFSTAFFSAVPAPAQTVPQAVSVSGCAANGAQQQQYYINVFGANVSEPAVPSVLMIDFQNVSPKPISAVEFGLVKDGKLITTVRDVGMFAPNAVIMHAYGTNYALGDDVNASCVPLRVQYADGTTWMSSNMPAHK